MIVPIELFGVESLTGEHVIEKFIKKFQMIDLPTPGQGCIPGYAACCNAASPFGSPWAGMDR